MRTTPKEEREGVVHVGVGGVGGVGGIGGIGGIGGVQGTCEKIEINSTIQ